MPGGTPTRNSHGSLALKKANPNPGREAHPFEVMLDSSDGMDWESFCDCSIMWVVDSALLTRHRGRVTIERRRAIRGMVRDLFLLGAID
jgi:hypothetical protein